MAEPTLPSQLTEERERAQYQIPLTALAGYAAGSTAGLLGVAPYNVYQTHRTEQALAKERELFVRSQQIWRVLYQIHTGKLSFDELPESERETWRSLYASRKSTLSNPNEMFRILNQQAPAEVIRPKSFQKSLFSRLMPSAETLRNPLRTAINHPVPIALGGIGGLLGQLYAQNKHDERMIQLMSQNNSGGQP